jgi:beta-glucosidase
VSPRFARRRYWNEESTPLFPFGFGLSYTDFMISKPVISTHQLKRNQSLSLSVEVRNTGARSGDEVVQLYTHQRSGGAARPVRELKAFQRVSLDAGEQKTVTFRLSTDDLKYWSTVERKWTLDNATFDVWVGNSSDAAQGDIFEVIP